MVQDVYKGTQEELREKGYSVQDKASSERARADRQAAALRYNFLGFSPIESDCEFKFATIELVQHT